MERRVCGGTISQLHGPPTVMASPDSEHPRGAASRPISWDIASPFGLVDKVGEGLLVFRLY